MKYDCDRFLITPEPDAGIVAYYKVYAVAFKNGREGEILKSELIATFINQSDAKEYVTFKQSVNWRGE